MADHQPPFIGHAGEVSWESSQLRSTEKIERVRVMHNELRAEWVLHVEQTAVDGLV